MYRTISETAIGLFLEKGFDGVSVAEIAEVVGVSKPTLFRYFPSKEDMVLHRFADHVDEAARTVAGRAKGETPVGALRRHFLAGLEAHDPVTGLSDEPGVLAFLRLLYGTPALVARMHGYQTRSEEALADALGGGVAARLAAGQIVAVQRVLAEENWRAVESGVNVELVHEAAVEAAELAFVQLSAGLSTTG